TLTSRPIAAREVSSNDRSAPGRRTRWREDRPVARIRPRAIRSATRLDTVVLFRPVAEATAAREHGASSRTVRSTSPRLACRTALTEPTVTGCSPLVAYSPDRTVHGARKKCSPLDNYSCSNSANEPFRWFLPTSAVTNRCSATGCVHLSPYPRSMPVPDFLLALRKHVGHDLLPLVGVTAVVVGDDGAILLHRRSDDGRWCTPGGILEPGEQPANAVVREVREETGVEVVVERLASVV